MFAVNKLNHRIFCDGRTCGFVVINWIYLNKLLKKDRLSQFQTWFGKMFSYRKTFLEKI